MKPGDAAGVALVAGSAAALLWFSWMKWPDVLIDFGRELYVPWVLADGKVLYRDVLYFAPPLSPYTNALWFRLFGPGLSVIAGANIGLLAILLATMRRVMRRMASPFAVTAACLTFVLLFAVGYYTSCGNYNYVTPYSHEATHGMLLSWIALACQLAHLRSDRPSWLAGSGTALGLVFLTKPEFFIGAAAASAASLALWAWRRPRGRQTASRRMMLFAACLLAPPLSAFVLLAARMTWPEAGIGVLGSWWYLFDGRITGLPYYREIMGSSDPGFNLGKTAYVLGLFLAVFAPAAALAKVHPGRRTATATAVAVFLILLAATYLPRTGFPWSDFGRPLPLIMLAAGCAILPGVVRHREDKDMAALVLVVFAFFLQWKMILNAKIWHYGFILGMPATMVLVLALTDWIPAAIRRRGGQPFAFQAVSLAFLAAAAVVHIGWSAKMYAPKTVPVGEGADAFLADPRGLAVNHTLAWLKRNTRPSDTLTVLPEGIMMNYLSRRPNPTPIVNLMPPEMIMFGSDRLLGLLQRTPPSYIALVHKDTTELGARFFGKDYGRPFRTWIMRNYRPVFQAGAMPFVDDRFGIIVLERNGTRSP